MKATLILAVIATSLLMLQLTSAAKDQICNSSAEPGPCKGHIPRYYYDRNSGECKLFVYGGCAGNGNNFSNKGSCENTCK